MKMNSWLVKVPGSWNIWLMRYIIPQTQLPGDSSRDLLIPDCWRSRLQPLSSGHVFTRHPKKATKTQNCQVVFHVNDYQLSSRISWLPPPIFAVERTHPRHPLPPPEKVWLDPKNIPIKHRSPQEVFAWMSRVTTKIIHPGPDSQIGRGQPTNGRLFFGHILAAQSCPKVRLVKAPGDLIWELGGGWVPPTLLGGSSQDGRKWLGWAPHL